MPSSLYKETLSGFLQGPVKKLTGGTRFGKLPDDVMRRSDISASCKVVLSGMAMESMGTGRIAISDQALAFLCGMSRPCVAACRPKLVKAGLLEPDGPKVEQVQPYRILHPSLISKNAPQAESASREVKKATITCPKCHKKRPMLLRSGICRSCAWDQKVRRIAREEIQGQQSTEGPALVA